MFCLDLTHLNTFHQAVSNLTPKLMKLRFTIHSRNHSFEEIDTIKLDNSSAIFSNELWQSRHWLVHHCYDIEEKRFTIYTIPYALFADCSTHRHRFAAAQQRGFTNFKIKQPVVWRCRPLDPAFIAQSLEGLRQTRHLHWHLEVRIRISCFLKIAFIINLDITPGSDTKKYE